MLTKRQNLLETIRGGKPDRYVNQYEFLNLIMEAMGFLLGPPMMPGRESQDMWGVTWRLPEGQIGPFPVQDAEHKVIKDITEWKKFVKKPFLPTADELWAPAVAHANAVNRDEEFVAVMYLPGVFEMLHHLMGMEDALMAFYEEPESVHELIDFITVTELEFAKIVVDKIHPDAVFHHDDWGSNINSFLSPEMFNEFILPAYKKIYGFYKANGVELIVHHSDSYAANLVPAMIEMGIDIWQGVSSSNKIPELIKQYGGQITFMGGIDSGKVDFPATTPELIAAEVEKVCLENGTKFFIPNTSIGAPSSSFPGIYDKVSEEIDRMSKILF